MSELSSPKISVIVPVYKVEEYLHRCIDSILSQSFTDFELILVDDGSPDNCGKICDEYAQKDSRIRVFHKSNGGVSSARNLGLDNAQGEWIAFIDSDDYVDVDYLAELDSYTQKHETDYVVTLNTIKEYTKENSLIIYPDDYGQLFSCYNFHNNGHPWGKLYKTEIIKNSHLRFNICVHLGEDAMFALQYLIETKNMILIHSDKYFYETLRPESLTKKLNSYDSESIGMEEFNRIVSLIKAKFNVDELAIRELECSQMYYMERTLSSLMKFPNQKYRLRILNDWDLSLYYKHKKPSTWKECVLYILLRTKCFYLYDLLMGYKG